MAPTQADGDPGPGRAAGGESQPDAPEQWGSDGMVGDGRYRLTHRLGRGGMAEVFAAEDVRLGRTVAVKLLRADLAADSVAKARFTREAQAVAGLNHHAVVAVYDSGEDLLANGDTVPFIVMEIVNGRTIRDLLVNTEAPPVDQALIIVSGVLEALAYSHQHGIVHRDIKPANVIITNSGAVKVMDFGIARALHGAASTMTQTGMVMGTPQYLSPEQALGKAVDARSDLYATGCLLYELLALRPPFTGETPLSVVYQHVQDDPKIPSEISDRVPPELDGLVLRALAKEPDDRYQSAEEMRGEVQYALRMLQQEGGNTGTWGTGHLGATPPRGMGAATAVHTPAHGTAAHTPPHGTGATDRLPPPVLIGPSGADGFGEPRRRRGFRKAALIVAASILAVGTGAFAAWNGNLNNGGGGGDTKQTHQPRPQDHKNDSTTPGGDDQSQTAPGDGGQQSWTPSDTNGGGTGGASATPSHSNPPSDHPTPSTSPPASSDPGTSTTTDGGTDDGGATTDGGTGGDPADGGTDDGGTADGGTTAGTDSGAAEGTTAGAQGADGGGTAATTAGG
ncbi:protein kinase domain-containing protein [Wenjunlia tyrosinilytica]|uniref:non-specific serine/threonine protein kinase n=1 Tax=Wenjunlia tyrosinilytica TaxID=1544741 RepID=A0A917ZJZ2_9ACTN|nr:protein kinase [Wenjunlia tyrosinilytica]GGO84589.1 serine/threonine protein kinase [Wenjunlia tyrosinilytica]